MILLLALTTAGADPLDAETALQLASSRALDATTAELAVLQQEIELRAARVAWTPSVTARLGGQGSLGRTFSEQLGTNVTEPIASLSGSLSASMPLYQGGALIADRRAAEASTGAAQKTREQTVLDVQWAAVDGLLAIGQAEDALAIQQAALQADRALLEQVELQVEAGAVTPADRYAQQAVVAARQSAVATAEQSRRNAELDLLTLLRLDPGASWTFEPPAVGPFVGHEADDLLDSALKSRSDLAAAADRITAAEQSERSARAAYLPSLSLGAGASTSWLSTRDASLVTQLDDQSRAWLSLDLSIPIFNAGARRSRVESAGVTVREAQVAEQRLSDEIKLDVHRLVAAQAAAEAAVEASAAAVDAARRATEVRELRYRSGAETLVSVTTARADQVDAELGLARADSALQRVRFELQRATGSPLG